LLTLSNHTKGLLYAFIAAVLWSTGGVFIKLISLNSFQLSFFRSGIAALTILIIFRKNAVIFNKQTIINGVFYSGILILFVLAAKTTTVANAIFLQYTAPVFVFIFEPIILKTKFEKVNLAAILICVIGMVLFFAGDLNPGDIEGNIYAILSGIAFAAFLIGMKKNEPKYQFASVFYGNLFISIICAFSVFSISNLLTSDIIMFTYMGMFQIGIAYVVFNFGLKRVDAVEASLISMIEPILNPVWTYLGYGEIPSNWAIVGGVIILIGLGYKTVRSVKL